MKQEDEWKVDVGNQWGMPAIALRQPQKVSTGVMEKTPVKQQDFFFFFLMLMFTLCVSGKNCFKCVHNWELLAKVNPFIQTNPNGSLK